MRFRLGTVFVDFRGKRPDARNVIDIREGERELTLGLLAEPFDSALSFYIAIIHFLSDNAQRCPVQLKAWSTRKVVKELDVLVDVRPSLVSGKSILYEDFPARSVGSLLNASWLSCDVILIAGYASSKPVKSLDALRQGGLPLDVQFLVEKQSRGISDFLRIRASEALFEDLIGFIKGHAATLKQPLVTGRTGESREIL